LPRKGRFRFGAFTLRVKDLDYLILNLMPEFPTPHERSGFSDPTRPTQKVFSGDIPNPPA